MEIPYWLYKFHRLYQEPLLVFIRYSLKILQLIQHYTIWYFFSFTNWNCHPHLSAAHIELVINIRLNIPIYQVYVHWPLYMCVYPQNDLDVPSSKSHPLNLRYTIMMPTCLWTSPSTMMMPNKLLVMGCCS